MRNCTEQVLLFSDLVHANGHSSMFSMRNYKCAKVSVVVTGTYDGLLKFQGTDQDLKPDLGAAVSATNQFSPVGAADYDSQNTIAGSTGINFNASPYNADGVYNFEIQSNGLSAIGLITSGATKGTIKAYIKFYDEDKNS